MSDLASHILPIIRSTRSLSLPSWGKAETLLKESDTAMTNVVTIVDRQIEEYLAKEFARIDPTIAFAGEEFGGDKTAKRFWLVDPIDGTAHYIRGLPFCTTMVALIEDGQVVFSAIYDFVHDVMYHAERGHGAYRDDVRLHVSERSLADAYISFEGKLQTEEELRIYGELKKHTHLIGVLASGWELARVAEGRLEGRINLTGFAQDHDLAPGSLLITEAGGRVTNIGSDTYDYRQLNLIATNAVIHDELTKFF